MSLTDTISAKSTPSNRHHSQPSSAVLPTPVLSVTDAELEPPGKGKLKEMAARWIAAHAMTLVS